MKALLLFFALLTTLFGFTQENATFSGSISDFSNGEELIGVKIYTDDHKYGALTNEYGFFSLTIPKGQYSIIISYYGYEKQVLKLDLSSSIQKNIQLKYHIHPKVFLIQSINRYIPLFSKGAF